MHDGADVLSFPKPERPKQASETDAVARRLDEVLNNALSDKLRADLVSVAYRHTLRAATDQLSGLSSALLALDPKHAPAFDGELKALYNHAFSLMNRIRASYGLPAFEAPGIPFNPAGKACVHPDVCTCPQCQAADSRSCGNE